MITDATGAEIRPTLHVPFRDYQTLLDENKRLREALELAKERFTQWADRIIFTGDDQDEFDADMAQINALAGFLALDAARLSKP